MTKNNKKILLVEDERAISKALETKLNLSGYEIEIANNGIEALAKLREKKFDLLLLDIMMPKMDGFTLMEEMKKAKIKIPIIILTNLSQEEDAERAKSYGVSGFLMKSNTPLKEIVEQINKFFKI